MVQWVELRPLLEVFAKETGYKAGKGGGVINKGCGGGSEQPRRNCGTPWISQYRGGDQDSRRGEEHHHQAWIKRAGGGGPSGTGRRTGGPIIDVINCDYNATENGHIVCHNICILS